jgi:hypothetical protein
MSVVHDCIHNSLARHHITKAYLGKLNVNEGNRNLKDTRLLILSEYCRFSYTEESVTL